jgi:hypothetical protein
MLSYGLRNESKIQSNSKKPTLWEQAQEKLLSQ